MAVRYQFSPRAGHAESRDREDQGSRSGTVVLRVDDYYLVQKEDADGTPLQDEWGHPVVEARGVWGTSLCSGERILVRLSTLEEEQAAGWGRQISPRRRSIEMLRGTLQDEQGRVMDPSSLPEEQRPVWRCDQARVLTDESGRPRASVRNDQPGESGQYTQMYCSWVTPYPPYVTNRGELFWPQEHMEADRFSTVNMNLAADTKPSYYRLFTEIMRQCAMEGTMSYAKAAAQAARTIVDAWSEQCRSEKQARFGSLSVTTWAPEEGMRFDLTDRDGSGRARLEAWLSDPHFEAIVRNSGTDTPFTVPSPVAPDCILRFLNDKEEVCGAYRVRAWEFLSLPSWARRHQRGRDCAFWESPQGRAHFVMEELVRGLSRDFVRAHDVVAVDILPGRRYKAGMSLMNPELLNLRTDPAVIRARLRKMIYTGIVQSRSLQEDSRRSPRQNIGCAQAFVPRTHQGYVTGYFTLRDGAGYRNAVLLLPGEDHLVPSRVYAEELERERRLFNNLPALFAGEKAEEKTDERAGEQAGSWTTARAGTRSTRSDAQYHADPADPADSADSANRGYDSQAWDEDDLRPRP